MGVSLGILVCCVAPVARARVLSTAEISGPKFWERPRMALADPRGVFSNRAGCLKRRH